MMSRGAVGLIGVVGVAALWAGAAAWKTGSIERQIAQNAVAEVKKRGLDRRFESLVLDVSGREIFFSGVALTEYDRRALAEAAAATPGVAASLGTGAWARAIIAPNDRPLRAATIRPERFMLYFSRLFLQLAQSTW